MELTATDYEILKQLQPVEYHQAHQLPTLLIIVTTSLVETPNHWLMPVILKQKETKLTDSLKKVKKPTKTTPSKNQKTNNEKSHHLPQL